MEQEPVQRHLAELRNRLKHVFIVFIVFSVFGFYFSGDILSLIQADLKLSLNALKAYEVLYTRIMISLVLGFFLSLPVVLYQALKFVKPGLKGSEYTILRNYLPFSMLLFIGGAAFAYQFVVKASLDFFRSLTASSSVEAVWGLQSTIGFALKLSAFTGVAFQLPIIAVVLAKAGFINSSLMRQHRKYFIVAVLLTSALVTPPDIVTQLLVTLPVLLLYEFSIFLVSRTT